MKRPAETRSVYLEQRASVEVTRVPFVAFESLKSLDLAKLERASRAVVELGRFESECCNRIARAVIKKGMITEIKVDPCKAAPEVRSIPELTKLLKSAQSKLKTPKTGKTARARKLPLPVGTALGRGLGSFIDIDIPAQWTCYTICITLFGHRWCFTCCITTIRGRTSIDC